MSCVISQSFPLRPHSSAPPPYLVLCVPALRGFKALKQVVKLLFKLGRREEMMEAYRLVFG